MSNFIADPLAFVECIGAFWLGYLLYSWMKAHPKLVHLNDEHLFIAASLPILVMLLIIASHWLFVFALIGAGWFALTVMGAQVVLFIVGFLKLVHWVFQLFGDKSKAK